MKAPEKIYLDSYGSGFSHGFHTNKLNDNDVEYVRTDAFIEKSYDFIRRKICDYIVHYNYGPNNDMETMYVDSRFFDDFKNHIKE